MDPYHFALTLTWTAFFVVLIAACLAINIGFAALYFAFPGSIPNLPAGSPIDAFCFSVETLATVGYGRSKALTDAVARLTVLMIETGPDGRICRRGLDLKLMRADLPFFPRTRTVMHELDEASPLHGLTPALAQALGLRLMFSVGARDPSLGAQVHAAQNYSDSDIAFGMR